jgi:hypothetical protein
LDGDIFGDGDLEMNGTIRADSSPSSALRRTCPLLWVGWLVSIALAVLFGAVFIQGIVRDRRIGEPVLRIDLASSADWTGTSFRVWGAAQYNLFISSVNHDPQFAGTPLGAEFEVAIDSPDGKPFFRNRYPAGSTRHVLPMNYGDSKLGTFSLHDWPWRTWTLKARVLQPDTRFKTARSEIKFWKDRYDAGMGGMMNYVMIIPAGIFLLLSLFAALALAQRKSRIPIAGTAVVGVVLGGFLLV